MSPQIRTFFPLVGLSLALFLAVLVSFPSPTNSSEGAARVKYLLTRLEKADSYKVRVAAATELGKIADGTLADWMLRAFRQESNSAVRLAILYAIGQIPDHRIVSPLLELANQEVLAEQEFLAIERVLWNVRTAIHTQSWETAATKSRNRSERATAAWLLGVAGGPSSLHALLIALKDNSAYVRMRAAQGIARLGVYSGRSACAQLARKDPDVAVRKVAKNCSAILALTKKGKLPRNRSHRVSLKADLYGLRTAAVTPRTYRDYVRKNVNPRMVDRAVSTLTQKSQAEERKDRTVELVHGERLRETFKLDASVISKYHFQTVELNRLRRVVRREAPAANQCYIQALKKKRQLRGKVVVQFRILKSGAVSSVRVVRATLPDKNVQACIAKKIQLIRFPKIPLAYVQMNYTFTFVPPKDQKFSF